MPGTSDKQKIITPPNILLQKMGGRIGGIDWKAIERANKSVAGIEAKIAANLLVDLKKLNDLLQEFMNNLPVPEPEESLLYHTAFETKGLAGSIGYGMVGRICGSLCDMLEKCSQQHGHFVAGLRAHVQAIQIVLARRDLDENSAENRELLAGLAKVVAKMAV